MFALAVWDSPRQRLVLARDRFGKKPLLWTQLQDGTVAFASELKALLTFPGVRRQVELERLDAYLALGYVPGDRTALRGHQPAAARVHAHRRERHRHGEPLLAARGEPAAAER